MTTMSLRDEDAEGLDEDEDLSGLDIRDPGALRVTIGAHADHLGKKKRKIARKGLLSFFRH